MLVIGKMHRITISPDPVGNLVQQNGEFKNSRLITSFLTKARKHLLV